MSSTRLFNMIWRLHQNHHLPSRHTLQSHARHFRQRCRYSSTDTEKTTIQGEQPTAGSYEEYDKRTMNELREFRFPFENLVFEGGGAKGTAYGGVVEVLEELNMLKDIKRFAGASAGSIVATLLALGCNSTEIKAFTEPNLDPYIRDTPLLYYPFNFFRTYGIHKAKKLSNYIEDMIGEKSGNRNLTFWELYKERGVELCIVVTNINQTATEYCHPKTTPDRSIASALRMSMSIPLVFQPVLHIDEYTGRRDYYVDGGVLCNYPIHCFDGWWLSMKPEDALYHKIIPLRSAYKRFEDNHRFGVYNPNTLGFTVYSADESEPFKDQLEERLSHVPAPVRPHTEMSSRVAVREQKLCSDSLSSEEFEKAADKFFNILAKSLSGRSTDDIRKDELLSIITEKTNEFSEADFNLLFGGDTPFNQLLGKVDADGDDKIEFYEIVSFMERRGLQISRRYQCFPREEVTSVSDFYSSLMSALVKCSSRVSFQNEDMSRTVGINTDYIDVLDFDMSHDDKQYMYKRGRCSAVSFLEQYIKQRKPSLTAE